MADAMLTLAHLAEKLGNVSEATVLRLAKKHGVPVVKAPGEPAMLSGDALLKACEWRPAKLPETPKPKPRQLPPLPALLSAADIAAAAQPAAGLDCGIYFLLFERRVVYVGMAAHVPTRIAQHYIGKKRFDAWHWVACPPKHQARLERAYIEALDPPLNRDGTTLARRRRAP